MIQETLSKSHGLGLAVELEVADDLLLGTLLGILDLLGLLVDVGAVDLLGLDVVGTEAVGSVVELVVPATISWQVTPSVADGALWEFLEASEEL